MLLETVIAPFWVWSVLAETPATASLLGGAVILAALIGHSIYAWHRRR
jgi:drug/metabolite transporter (DMT)-like permease